MSDLPPLTSGSSRAAELSRCQRAFANSLDKFQFDCIGGSQTDDEIVIAGSLKQFAALINLIEEERQRTVSVAVPLASQLCGECGSPAGLSAVW